MKKIIVLLILVVAVLVGCFLVYKSTKNNEEPAKTNSISTMNQTNTVENKVDNKVENEAKNETSNEVENKTSEKEEKTSENTVVPSSVPVYDKGEEVFLTDFDNYNPSANLEMISQAKAKEIAQVGFEESKARIAGEGADDVDSETVKIEEISPNNYFTRKDRERDTVYTNIKRKAYIFTRTNDMGNGIRVYVDAYTGLIIGGAAFGD